MAQSLRFTRTWLANYHVPGKFVEVFAPALEFVQPFFEFLAQLIEFGSRVWIADRLGSRAGLRFNGGRKMLATTAPSKPGPKKVAAEKQDRQKDNGYCDPD